MDLSNGCVQDMTEYQINNRHSSTLSVLDFGPMASQAQQQFQYRDQYNIPFAAAGTDEEGVQERDATLLI